MLPVSSPAIVFFDGDCLFCNRSVQTLVALDDDESLSFAPLQGETAARLLPSELRQPDALGTMVFRDPAGRIATRSAAVLNILRHIGAPWSALGLLALAIPRSCRDALYDAIARNRHRLLRQQACSLPDPRDRPRFLP